MSNMYGYSDYQGPQIGPKPNANEPLPLLSAPTNNHNNNGANDDEPHDSGNDDAEEQDEEEEDQNPLQAGFWMEGDSLAPPCGTAVPTIHRLLEFAHVQATDVLYDLGCGDARICLESYAHYHCVTVGVEVEPDLVERAQVLIAQLPDSDVADDCNGSSCPPKPRVIQQDLRVVLQQLIRQAKQSSNGNEKVDTVDQENCLPLPTVIFMYLLPDALTTIQSDIQELLELLPSSSSSSSLRIICNTWGFRGWNPMQKAEFREENGAMTVAFLYTRQSIE